MGAIRNSGIFSGGVDYVTFENCVNYANANISGFANGFIGGNSDNWLFIDCHNYGMITSKGNVYYDPDKQ